ncbi:MAG TPA: glycoside hydrolase family 28 protein [Bacteroidales bacterium]
MKHRVFTVIHFSLLFLITEFYPFASVLCQDTGVPRNLMSPVGSETDSTITLIWDKPDDYKNVTEYKVFCNNKTVGTSGKINYTVNGLKPDTHYSFYIKAKNFKGQLSKQSNAIEVSTKKHGEPFNIIDFGAKGDDATINTAAIQKAIDACTPGGTVYIPKGTFLSGALFLKSDMTLYIAEGGILKGSENINDYYPLIPTRFEGWEVKSFASLITAGKLDRSGNYNIRNISICGQGTILGGGQTLGKAWTAAEGARSRGRLICIMNCENLNIQGLKVLNSPCWTIHYTYSKNITIHDLTIVSTASNGDGIDPDSSTDSYIFNCSFSTGDDCIAIKSGKNPEGNMIDKPCVNVRITDCIFIKGHSLAIGSEISGGVKNVFIQDCKIGALDNGLRIKTNKFRGGYVENVTVKDCDLLKILVTTQYTPNNDGAAAPDLSYVRNLEFSNLNMNDAAIKKPVISVDGFDDPEHYFKGLVFKNITLPDNANISIKYCNNVLFDNVFTTKGQKPVFVLEKTTNIKY